MLTLQILGLGPLRRSIFPLLAVANSADVQCLPTSASLTISYSEPDEEYCFLAVLRMFDPFFTISPTRGGGDDDGDDDYHCEIDLAELSRLILKDDLYLTILIPKSRTSVSLISSTRVGKFRSLTSLRVTPPKNEDVGHFDHKLFVAIDVAKFKEIATQLSDDDGPTTVWATASTSQVRFCVRGTAGETVREIVLTTERRECLAGGFDDRVTGIYFSFTLSPKEFFLRASDLTKLVWFFGSTYWPTTVICFVTRELANIMACYSLNSSNLLLHSFLLNNVG